jgi:splicing factor U2AF subunit
MMDLNPSDGAASLQNNLPSQNTISESLIQEPEPAQSLNAGRKSESKNENEKNATTYQRSGEKDKDKDKDKDRDKNHSHDRRRHHSDRRERERERERDKERDRDKSKDKDKDRDRTKKERDKERDKEKDKDKERDKERGRDKDKEHDSERKDKSDHHSSKRKRSPSPDFSQRKKTGWDQMPAMGTSTPQVTKPQIVGVPGLVTLSNQARQQRRLYVGNIPATVSEFELMEFFNTVMMSSGVLTNPGPPVIGIQLNREKSYAFLEFRFPEEATAGMKFDGITLQGHALKVRRPKDYQPTAGEHHVVDHSIPDDAIPAPQMHIVSTNVEDTPHKVFIGGIPSNLNEEEVKELLQVFGLLKSFNLVRDTTTGVSKGYAFCEYLNPEDTDKACKGLNKMKLGDKTLVVQRASVGAKGGLLAPPPGVNLKEPPSPTAVTLLNVHVPAAQLLASVIKEVKPVIPTRILVLMNCINVDEFPTGQDYEDMKEDILLECRKFGPVVQVVIPQPPPKKQTEEETKVYLKVPLSESQKKEKAEREAKEREEKKSQRKSRSRTTTTTTTGIVI